MGKLYYHRGDGVQRRAQRTARALVWCPSAFLHSYFHPSLAVVENTVNMLWVTSPLTFFAIALAVSVAASDADTHPYVAPGPGDVRSPCPGLNSLANHGFLPHNGKAISVPLFVSALKDGLNVGADFAISVGSLAQNANPTLLQMTVDLDQLDEHNFPIEHDASLSRMDAYFGDDHSFNQAAFNQVLAYFDGSDTATIPAASLARYHRVQACETNNPTCIYGARQLVLSYGETALYLSTMGNPTTGDAPVSYIKSLFENETLPYHLGWTKPTEETNLVTLGAMITQLALANPEILPEGLTLGEGTLNDVYNLKDPITGKLINSTCALLSLC
ncbi:Hypothetical protein R9X50_00666400 [Acrodontium crateriforme]|uniref:Heme haloperoxidase family profile domain-containing protein n=1 Tax=Acrodontium crateriforme TaxID=150365 RepID=A0AAQ3RBQ0_9PEZI|nr:Hypothetical protein R9X50_00666400 [Acrodontium crateriforme]